MLEPFTKLYLKPKKVHQRDCLVIKRIIIGIKKEKKEKKRKKKIRKGRQNSGFMKLIEGVKLHIRGSRQCWDLTESPQGEGGVSCRANMDKWPLNKVDLPIRPTVHGLESEVITSTRGERHSEKPANSTHEGLGLNPQQLSVRRQRAAAPPPRGQA